MNPPHFHLLILPLVSLPPAIAFSVWIILGFICLIISVSLIINEIKIEINPLRLGILILALSACSGMSTTLVTGQMSFFLFLLITYAWIKARNGKWLHAAVFIGIAISVKSFLLVFMPYFIIRRQANAACLALVVAVMAFIVGAIIFGLDSYASWLNIMSKVDWAWAAMNGSILGFLSRILSQSPYFVPLVEEQWLIYPTWVALAASVGIVTIIVIAKDYNNYCIDRGFALILIAALLMSPLGWIYYLWIVLGPSICLIHSWYTKKDVTQRSEMKILRNSLVIVSSMGALIPLPVLLLFQPSPVATLTFGSIYFWVFLSFWMALSVDYSIQAVKK